MPLRRKAGVDSGRWGAGARPQPTRWPSSRPRACSCWRCCCGRRRGPFVPHDLGRGLLPRRSRAAATTPPAALRSRPSCPRSSRSSRSRRAPRGRSGSPRPGAARRSRRSRASAPLILLHRLCSELRDRRTARLACAAVAFFPFAYVLSTNYSEGLFLLASIGAFSAARSRHPALAFAGGPRRRTRAARRRSRSRSASRPTPYLSPERRRASLAGAAGAVAGVALVFADLKRRRDDWLASLHAQQIGWDRSTSVVDAPGELARYVCDAITLGHAQNLLYLTAVPLAVDRPDRAVAERHPRRHVRLRGDRRRRSARHGQRDVAAALPDGHVPVRRGRRASCSTAWTPACAALIAGAQRRRARGLHVGDLSRRRACAVTSPSSSRSPPSTRARRWPTTATARICPRRTSIRRRTPWRTARDAYGGLDYEYPPATLPLLVAPLAAGGDDSGQAYHQRTIWLYGALDVGCVLLLGYLLRAPAAIELALALGALQRQRARARAARAHALRPRGRASRSCWPAHCARSPGRAGAWLGLAGALKLVPLAAAPALTRRGHERCACSPPRRPSRSPRRSSTRSGAASSGCRGSATTPGAIPRSSRGRRCSPTSRAASARTRARPSTTAART